MRIPFSWLSEYVDISGLSPQEIADKLTMGAFEVEEVRLFGPAIQGPIVVGEIVEIHPHPNANKIRLTKVRVDTTQAPLEIVCGAQNIEVGQIVPVALPGSKVINRHDGNPLPITTTTIRGVSSHGMLCSPPELGLSTGASDGILILARDLGYKLGEDIKTILFLHQDHILHVSPRSNRGDALSIRGVAREVAALTKRPLKALDWSLPSQIDLGATKFTTTIEDLADCELFTIRSLANLKVGQAPAFITRRLEAVGVRSINNIVDITNYVMNELGQSLHAYDARKIAERCFVVRRARPAERLKTLDGKERNLTSEVLVISDKQCIVGLAGIMGGLESEVSADTTEIALEAASFEPARVRRATRLLGLSSEASLRFERGVDVNSVVIASDRASYLLARYCGGNRPVAIGQMSKAGSEVRKPVHVSVRTGQIKRLIEIDLNKEEIVDMLKPLGFKHVGESNQADCEQLEFLVPSFRQKDVTREIDLIEEICRIYGYDRIAPSMPHSTGVPAVREDVSSKVKEALSDQGLSEAYISSLVPDSAEADSNLSVAPKSHGSDQDSCVRVLNPLSKDHAVLRQSLLPGLLRVAKYNQNHGEVNIWLFEIGRTYAKHSTAPRQIDDHQVKNQHGQAPKQDSPVKESLKVAGILMGNCTISHWSEELAETKDNKNGQKDGGSKVPSRESHSSATGVDFYQAKGIIENLFCSLRIDRRTLRFQANQPTPSVMHPSKSTRIFYPPRSESTSTNVGKSDPKLPPTDCIHLGWLGEIHPNIADQYDLSQSTYLFEIDMSALDQLSQTPFFVPIMTSPAVSRDLTIDLAKSVDHYSVVSCLANYAGPNLRDIELVSKFGLSNDRQSLSYRLTFQHPEQTLRSEEVDAVLEKIRAALTKQLAASFRL